MYWNHMDFPIYAPKSIKFMHKKGNLKQVRTQENIVKPQEWFLPGKCSHAASELKNTKENLESKNLDILGC